MRLSVIIVSYNSEGYIKQCLDSVCSQDFFDYEIILIDNHSSDRTLDTVRSFGHRIRLKINEKNEGFSGALNMGIELSKGDYILTLNPDVILEPGFLSEVNRNIGEFSDDIGMAGVKILKRVDSKRIIDSTGLMLSGAVRFFDRGSGEKDLGQYDRDKDILGPCAAAAVYKRAMLEDIKVNNEYFDKDFFYLIEDFDIALRAKNKGWRGLYMPGAVCYHARNGSGTKCAYRQYLTFRNRYFLMIKGMELRPYSIFCFFIYDIPRIIIMLLTNRYTLRAIRELKEYTSVMIRKRIALNNIQRQ